MLLYHCTRGENVFNEGEKNNVQVDPAKAGGIPLAVSLVDTPGEVSKGGTKIEPERVGACTYGIEYHVPLALWSTYWKKDVTPKSGTVWRGNIYKCADATSHPHRGAWATVGTPRPNFHRPSGVCEIMPLPLPRSSQSRATNHRCGCPSSCSTACWAAAAAPAAAPAAAAAAAGAAAAAAATAAASGYAALIIAAACQATASGDHDCGGSTISKFNYCRR